MATQKTVKDILNEQKQENNARKQNNNNQNNNNYNRRVERFEVPESTIEKKNNKHFIPYNHISHTTTTHPAEIKQKEELSIRQQMGIFSQKLISENLALNVSFKEDVSKKRLKLCIDLK